MGTATLTIRSQSTAGKRALDAVLAWWQRSIQTRAARRRLRVEQSAAIGNKGTVALISVDGEHLLVGVTNGCIQFHSVRGAVSLDLPIGGTVR